MHELKRSKSVEERLKLGDEIIVVKLDPESVGIEFNKRRNAIILAEQALKTATDTQSDDALNAYAEAVSALFALIFGEENAVKIINFYENRFIEMSIEVFPFIVDIVAPQINRAIAEMRKKAANAYKSNKKNRL